MKKHIDDIFKDKLENFEAPVSDGLWDKIQQNPEWQQHLKRQKIRNLSIYAILAVIVISSCAVLLHQRHNTANQDIETAVVEEEIITENAQEATTKQPSSNPEDMPTLTTDETAVPANPIPETTDTPIAQNATETMIPAEDNSNVVNPTNTEPTISQNNSVPEKSSEKTAHNNNNSNNKSTPAAESNNKSDKTPDGNESYTTPSHPSENANPSSSLFSIPNAFTPNGDGLNDVFKPVTAASLQQYQLDIFAINGQHLFTSRNIEYGWNGEFQGSIMNGGNYIYVIKYRDSGGKEHIDKGQLLLIR